MATEYMGLSYFPLSTNFFEKALQELLEAKFGIRGPYITIKLMCKLYTESYFLPWGDEHALIFANKLGSECGVELVREVIALLLEKEFFDQGLFDAHQVLTSAPIQRVWAEATCRRKRDVTQLPYLLIDLAAPKTKGSTARKGNKLATEPQVNEQNVNTIEQSKGEQSRVEQNRVEQNKAKNSPPLPSQAEEEWKREEELIVPPAYALNTHTHNYEGLMLNLSNLRITDKQEVNAILRLSNYGEMHRPLWKIMATTNWSKITTPGRFLIKALRGN